ncbi:hypothetical protein INT45_007233 [Circinella minor]|uniref:Uncharacterized protein n=1 Tax=Circinella minor TaxID=1195481 RepID=A0A8H7RWS4_9FUNG|nr:hypothetical protein INT45_007233 [Circinella minor]
MDLYNICAADNSILSTRNRTFLSDLASLIILHSSTAHTTGSQYRFIAQRQGAAHAIILVQTQVERNKYDSLIRQHFPQQLQRNRQPDFDKFSKLCYKEQIETLQYLRSPSRKRNIAEAQNSAALKIPQLQAIIYEATNSSSSSSPPSAEEERSNTEHPNSTIISSSNEIIHNNNTTNTIKPTIFYNPCILQHSLDPPFSFTYAAPSSDTSIFDGLRAPPHLIFAMSAFDYFRTVPVKEWMLLDILKSYDNKFNNVTLSALCNRIKQDLNEKIYSKQGVKWREGITAIKEQMQVTLSKLHCVKESYNKGNMNSTPEVPKVQVEKLADNMMFGGKGNENNFFSNNSRAENPPSTHTGSLESHIASDGDNQQHDGPDVFESLPINDNTGPNNSAATLPNKVVVNHNQKKYTIRTPANNTTASPHKQKLTR